MAVIYLLVSSCGNGKENPVTDQTISETDDQLKITEKQFNQNKMQLGTLEEKEFPVVVKVTGLIDVPPENRSVVSATMGGYIKTLPLLIGDFVKKGQVVLTLENPEFVSLQQEYLETHEQLSYLKSEYDRQKTLYDENISSQKSYLKAESDYKTALAKHSGLKKQLSMLNIPPANVEAGKISSITTMYAPITGSVTQVNVSKGSYVAPATPILEIIDNDHIHLELSVFEKDILKIKKEQPITFKIPESSSEIFKAEVHLVGTSMGAERTIKVHGHLINEEENNFLTGMFVEADIITETRASKALPNESIVNVEGKDYLLVLDRTDNETYYFVKKEVQTKDSYGGYTIIDNSEVLKSTDQFLVKGAFSLLGE